MSASLLCAGCSGSAPRPAANNQPAPAATNSSPANASTKIATALPNSGFKALYFCGDFRAAHHWFCFDGDPRQSQCYSTLIEIFAGCDPFSRKNETRSWTMSTSRS